jgi:hypothetical protein
MRQPNVPEGIDAELVAAIRRDVKLEELIRMCHDTLGKELASQRGHHRRLDSPFGPPGNKSVIVFRNPDSDDVELHWADPLAPRSIPRDVIGFQMAFKGWSYEEAVEHLAAFREDSLAIDRDLKAPKDPMSYPKGPLRRSVRAQLAEQDLLEHAEEICLAEQRHMEDRFGVIFAAVQEQTAAVTVQPKKQ